MALRNPQQLSQPAAEPRAGIPAEAATTLQSCLLGLLGSFRSSFFLLNSEVLLHPPKKWQLRKGVPRNRGEFQMQKQHVLLDQWFPGGQHAQCGLHECPTLGKPTSCSHNAPFSREGSLARSPRSSWLAA